MEGAWRFVSEFSFCPIFMKIGICCNKLAHSGGMERYALDLIEYLVSQGHDIIVYAKKADLSIPIAKKIKVVVKSFKFYPQKLKDYAFSSFLEKEFLKENFDVTLGCSRNDATDVILCGGTHLGFVENVKKKADFFDKMVIKLEKSEFKHAKLIVAHSKLIASEIVNLYGIDKNKVCVIYPPTQTAKFKGATKDEQIKLREYYNLPQDKILFLFPSSSHERKGYALLSKVFSKSCENIELVVAGKPIKKPLSNVRYIGYVKDIEKLYRACDYAILGSLYEPFGLVAIESVLSGKPSIMAENIGCCEVINAEALVKFSQNEESLQSAIDKVLENPPVLKEPFTQYLNADLSVESHVEKLLRKIELLK